MIRCLEEGKLAVVDGVVEVDDVSGDPSDCPDISKVIRENIKNSGKLTDHEHASEDPAAPTDDAADDSSAGDDDSRR